jgi:hypothetical protein
MEGNHKEMVHFHQAAADWPKYLEEGHSSRLTLCVCHRAWTWSLLPPSGRKADSAVQRFFYAVFKLHSHACTQISFTLRPNLARRIRSIVV